ncbi:MAG: S1C family serine protease [Actinobacteria bacterium]|nr:S1C family serine protease [Actinomycetota bacterium]
MENQTSDASVTSALSALSDGMADAVEKIGPSVVQVNGRRRRAASGVVYATGRVLTASHVLEREEDLSIVTHDGHALEARLLGRDPSTNLAVLEVPELGDGAVAEPAAGEVRVGQISLAVARPTREGLRGSFGIVSAVGGPLRTGRGVRLEKYLQTDARPYPGYSGGPLIDAGGAVLGITALGLARGVALAVPSEIAWRVAGALSERGSVKRGYLGILSQPVRLPAAQRVGLGDQRGGLLVVGVEDGSPAGKGGMLLGDILVSLDTAPVVDTDELQALLTGDKVGHEVSIGVIRGGELQTLRVAVGERG